MLLNLQFKRSRERVRTAYLSKRILVNHVLTAEAYYTFCCGKRSAGAQLLPHDRDDQICLSSDLAEELLIPRSSRQIHFYVNDNRIRLGPVVGVFVNPRFYLGLREGAIPISARQMVWANEKFKGILFYFSTDGIRWIDRKILGLYPDSQGRWRENWYPLPEVVYDRGVNFRGDEKILVKEFRRQIRSSKIYPINSRPALDKLAFWKALNALSGLRVHLPAVQERPEAARVLDFLDQYGLVFLKPTHTNRGRGIVVLKKINSSVEVCYVENSELNKRVLKHSEIAPLVEERFSGTLFIAQQGIDLVSLEGRKADMRILIVKDGRGEWTAVNNELRLGTHGNYFTNEALGAEVFNCASFFSSKMGLAEDEAKRLDDQARRLCLQVGRQLEEALGSMGEIGLDLGYDTRFGLWLFEGNMIPDKDPVPQIYPVDELAPQFRQIIEYAAYLAGYS